MGRMVERQNRINELKQYVLDFMEDNDLDHVKLEISHTYDYAWDGESESRFRDATHTYVAVDGLEDGEDHLKKEVDRLQRELQAKEQEKKKVERDRDTQVVQQLTVDVLNRYFKKPVASVAEVQPDV